MDESALASEKLAGKANLFINISASVNVFASVSVGVSESVALRNCICSTCHVFSSQWEIV